MKGTEKQIKWASDIINKLNENLDGMIKYYNRLEAEAEGFGLTVCGYTDNEILKIKDDCNAAFEKMDAKQIIDGRGRFADIDRIERMAKMLYKETH